MSKTLNQMAAAAFMAVGLAVAGQGLAATQAATMKLPDPSAITVERPDSEFSGTLFTLGFSFSVLKDLVITSLGAYDSGQDGLASAAQVGIWDTTGGAPLISVIVPAGTVGELDGYFRYTGIPSFNLRAGTTYVVGAFSTNLASSLFPGTVASGTIDSRLVLINDAYIDDSGFSYPYKTEHMAGPWLAANFRIAPIPEPETYQMLALGLVAVTAVATLRRRRQDAGN
jgi:hypothetical protein